MSSIVREFLDYALSEYGFDFPQNIIADGKLHRYKMKEDKGSSKSGFVQFHHDEFPSAIFGHWKHYGSEKLRWSYRKKSDMNKEERARFAKMRAEQARKREIEEARMQGLAIGRAKELWSMEPLNINPSDYPYLAKKKCGAHGVKFFDNLEVFKKLATEEQMDEYNDPETDKSHPKYASTPTMCIPATNFNGDIVSIQRIGSNGFKGYQSDAPKGIHKISGDDSVVFLVEGYATGATIHELTGCTTYVAFDCGQLLKCASWIKLWHPDDVRIIASDNDRFTLTPVNNPGQSKAKEVCSQFGFYNLKPLFHEGQDGTDWNDLLNYYSFEVLKEYTMKRLQILFDTYDL